MIVAGGAGPAQAPRVLLIGMMGAGKSTVARSLAERLGWPLLDTDRSVEQRRGRTVADLFAHEGEAAFRAEETVAIEAVSKIMGPIVVSVGGGAVTTEASRLALSAAGTVVWLRARPATLALRVGSGRGRPLLAQAGTGVKEALGRLAREREAWYEAVSDIVVDVDDLTTRQTTQRVLDALGWAPALAAVDDDEEPGSQ